MAFNRSRAAMHITQSKLRGIRVLALHGNLFGSGVELLLLTVGRAMQATPHMLVLDFRDVPTIDAAGIGALASAYGLVTRTGTGFTLARLGRRVRTLLSVCGLECLFEYSDAAQDSIAEVMHAEELTER